jgi:hypothetical protein
LMLLVVDFFSTSPNPVQAFSHAPITNMCQWSKMTKTKTILTWDTALYADISDRKNGGSNMYFATVTSTTEPKPRKKSSIVTPTNTVQQMGNQNHVLLRRELGSQENLMLPRQYSPNPDVTFPSMNHVSCALLNHTPSTAALHAAIVQVMRAHPLLRATIQGDGEPDKRIDLFQMVRQGDNRPTTFVAQEVEEEDDDANSKVVGRFNDDNVLKIVYTQDLTKSWNDAFVRDLDDGSWCQVETTPLWKVELHRLHQGNDTTNTPSALLLSFNHAISDQSSASRLTDQILELVADYENNYNNNNDDNNIIRVPKSQDIPLSVEESVLGKGQRWKDIQMSGISTGTLRYVAGKAWEETKSPVILPDDFDQGGGGGGMLGAMTTITGKAAGGEDTTPRHSVVAFRSLTKETSDALLAQCRENGVSITNALSAATTLTSTDFVNRHDQPSTKGRNYKILQSLDMRRFGAALDKGESVGCLAGSMDLMHGPLTDGSGRRIRSNPTKTKKALQLFWDLASEGKAQTESFIASDGPSHAVRVFDFAMTISDLNNLVHLTAQSKNSQGRAYSAGFTNAGVYERLDSFEYQGDHRRQPLKVRTSCSVYHLLIQHEP